MNFIYTKKFIVFSAVVIIIFGFLVLQTKGWLQPIEYAILQTPRPIASVMKAVIYPFKATFSTIGSLKSLVKENGELKFRLAELQQKQVIFDKLVSDNELLRNELNFVAKTPLALQSCTVLSSDPQDLSDALIIGCGESDGIKVGQGVISNGFLVAKIIHVGSLTSTAVLITGAQSTVDAKVSKNNTEGVVKGSFGSGIILDLVSQNAEVEPSDLIITAGINERIPAGIIIGEVGQILSADNDLFKKMSLVSPINFKTLQYVFVVK